MAKRSASNQLTKDNCEEDDPVEEAGHFIIASREELARRPIKTARRKLADSTGTTTSLFSGFKGFTSTPTPATSATVSSVKPPSMPFKGFFLTPEATESSLSTGFSSTTFTNTVFVSQSSVAPVIPSPISAADSTHKTNGKSEEDKVIGAAPRAKKCIPNDEFLQQLKLLNKSVLAWADQHVRENPYIDLQPVFSDYADHLKNLEQKRDEKQNLVGSVMPGKPPLDPATKEINEKTEEGMKPMMKTPEDTDCGENKTSEIINQDRTITEKSSSAAMSTFSFGSTTGTSFPAFGFFNAASSSTPLNSNTVAAASTSDKADQEDGEEPYIPPKQDIIEIEEPGSVYSTRCKLFFQNKEDNKYKEKGVGLLHLKPNDNGKVQLLIRAGTATGNILLNVLLTESMPTARMGKNNVTVVCIPNPPLNPKKPHIMEPTTMLIRVKNPEDADELLNKLELYKTGSA